MTNVRVGKTDLCGFERFEVTEEVKFIAHMMKHMKKKEGVLD